MQSVGWAVIDLDDDGRPCGIRRAGVRCFDSGVGSETEIASGKDESQNIKRRQARLQRRQLWRRGRRLKKVFHAAPEGRPAAAGEAANAGGAPRTAQQARRRIGARRSCPRVIALPHICCRTGSAQLALDQPLPPFAFGRALFHLAQRRGFLSNRKSAAKDDEEAGDVKAGISELRQNMQEAGARTLGEYFAAARSRAESESASAGRLGQMYLDEFEKIWSAQAPHIASLNDDWKQRIHDGHLPPAAAEIAKGLIGFCELGAGLPPRPRASMEAQRFRYLQKVNDLEIHTPTGEIWAMIDPEHAELRRSSSTPRNPGRNRIQEPAVQARA